MAEKLTVCCFLILFYIYRHDVIEVTLYLVGSVLTIIKMTCHLLFMTSAIVFFLFMVYLFIDTLLNIKQYCLLTK